MAQSSIEWTEMTWNPVTGCSKISAGCKFCYAEVMTKRLQAMGVDKYKDGFAVRTHPDSLKIPYGWKKPKTIFVNSMSDLFHPEVPLDFIQSVFKVMNENPQHIFQVLTKRADILLEFDAQLNWTKNIWMGVSVENEKVMNRIDCLRQTHAQIKFISAEPLIGAMLQDWVEDIQNQCVTQGVAFFFKQWGGANKKKTGRLLNGQTFDEMPA
jgi:protein gp37